MFLYKSKVCKKNRTLVMVAGINGFSLSNLDSIQNELKFVSTDEFGDITQETQAKLTSDASKAVDRFGVNKFSLTQRLGDLIKFGQKQDETSKETSPTMDLSLDTDIPEPPKV